MKRVRFDKKFIKNFKRRMSADKKLSDQSDERFNLFEQGVRDYPLNDHALKGKLQGFRAFSVSGDIRVVYVETEEFYIFKDVGSHNQVYQ